MNKSMHTISCRRQLCRWCGWFFVANTLLFFLIGINYFFLMPNLSDLPLLTVTGKIIDWVFIISGLLGQFSVFAFTLCVIAVLAVSVYPRRWFIYSLSCLLAAAMALLLVIDSVVYHLYHYHLAGVVWHVIRAGVAAQVLELSWLEWLWAAVIACVLVCIECGLAYAVEHWVSGRAKRQGGLVALIVLFSLFVSYMMVLSADTVTSEGIVARANGHVITMESQIIPYFDTVLGLFLPQRNGAIFLETVGAGFFKQNAQVNKPLRYPLQPLHFKKLTSTTIL